MVKIVQMDRIYISIERNWFRENSYRFQQLPGANYPLFLLFSLILAILQGNHPTVFSTRLFFLLID